MTIEEQKKTSKTKLILRKIGREILDTIVELREPVHFSLYRTHYIHHGYSFKKSDFHREIKRLEKRKFVALIKTEKGWFIKLLAKGQKRLKHLKIENVQLKQPKAWDGKWRLFIFDIPEKYKLDRDRLREKLKELGLYNIQRSVFVYPYDCRKELEFISETFDLHRYTTYAQIDYIDIDKQLKRHFNLS